MSKITVPLKEQVSTESQLLFDQLQKRIGKVPNLYATIGYSSFALSGFLEFENTLNHGSFSGKEREAISLIVSEVNGCQYCLAAHTLAGIKRGFTKEETLEIRRGKVDDEKLNVIIQLAKSITETKGKPNDLLLDNFYKAGFAEAAVMELIGLVTARIFTNYVFAFTEIPVDYPLAEHLQ